MSKFGVVILIMSVAALMTCSVCFAATTVTSPPGAFSAGWNLFALPAIPTEPAPGSVLDELGGEEGLEVRGMHRWDALTQNLLPFSTQTREDFGNLLPGSGYWVRLGPEDPTTISFTGVTDPDSTDMWINLPRAGWTLIGHPYSYPAPDPDAERDYVGDAYLWHSVNVTDGTVTKTLYEASQYSAYWVNSNVYWFDSSRQGIGDIGLPDDCSTSDSLIAWHGYWVKSYKDNLALIMEARNQ